VERLQLLLVFLLLQSIILYFIEEGAGRLTGYQRMGFIAAFCVAFLIGAYFINRIVDVLTPRFIHLMVKALVIVPIVSAILLTNGFMLRYFNTLMWPYLWPRPLLYVLMAAFVVIMMFPELFAGIWALRVIGLAMVFVGECYVGHSLIVMLEDRSVLSAMHFIGISGTYLVMVVSYLNQIWPKNNVEAPPLPDELPYVAAVIPTYGEPVDILRQTVHSLKNLDYPRERLHIVISDDGHRDEVRIMAESMDIHYSMGARKDAKAGNLNSALLYLDEHFPQATLILTQDADEIVHPSFLKKTVGYFADEKMAFVQTPKDAMAPHGDPFGVRDRVFYDVIQPGRNGMGAAFSCGSGVLWRIEAVKSIGGYATWNIVEDLTTSYFLHAAGWKSEYHNEILTIGLAPDDIPGLLKQRGTWATDTWRLFLFQNPLAKPGLTMAQRLQYMELGLFYITSSFFMPLVLLTPMMSLFTGDFVPIEGSALFPWIVISVLYYISLAQGVGEFLKRMWQYWVGHCPTYIKAFFIAIRSRTKKPSYKVTRKTRVDGFYGWAVWPQFLYMIAGAAAIIYGLFFMPEVNLGARLTNSAILLFFMFLVSGIVQASFYGVTLPHQRLARYIQQRFITRPIAVSIAADGDNMSGD
jgi:cellulose synthase (UDP-forming)